MVDGARREQVHGIANFGDLGEEHRRPGAHQEVRRRHGSEGHHPSTTLTTVANAYIQLGTEHARTEVTVITSGNTIRACSEALGFGTGLVWLWKRALWRFRPTGKPKAHPEPTQVIPA